MRGKFFQTMFFVLCLFPGIPCLIIYTKDWPKLRVPYWYDYVDLVFVWVVLVVATLWLGNEVLKKKWSMSTLILAVSLYGGGVWLLFSAFEALNCWFLIAGEALIISAIALTGFTKAKNKIKKGRRERCSKIF